MSVNATPVVSPEMLSASPVEGATVASLLALYVQYDALVQSRPPYTATPSREVPTTRFSP
jgi:hypothetical protein